MISPLLCAALAAGPAPSGKPLTVGLIASTNKAAADLQGKALAAFAKAATGREAKADVYADYEALAAALAQGEVDVALMPPLAYVRAEEKAQVEPLFKVVRNGQGTYRALLFAAPR